MEKVNGRAAVTVMAEIDLGLREVTEEENKYVLRQFLSFTNWLQTTGLNKYEASQRVRDMYNLDTKALEGNALDEFIWSRHDGIGDMEIDIITAISNDHERRDNLAHLSDTDYWNSMEKTADRAVDHPFNQEVFRRSKEKFTEVENLLNKLKDKYEDVEALKPNDRRFLSGIKAKVNQLRFGKITMVDGVKYTKGGGELQYKHWALAYNMIQDLLRIEKKMKIKTFDKDDDDVMNNYPVYGVDFNSLESQ